MIDALVFDLDDTLYPEHKFVASGYRAVAHHVASRYGGPEDVVFARMMAVFRSCGRDKVLDTVVEEFTDFSAPVSELVEVYRNHKPEIRLPSGYCELLGRLRRESRLGILTDGLPEVQKRKIGALGLQELVDAVVYTWEYGREFEKPHVFGFGKILAALGAGTRCSVFIGDSVQKDGRGALDAGMRFIHVAAEGNNSANKRRAAGVQADFVIDNLHELPVVLQLARRYETD